MTNGTVKFYNSTKGFGFITPESSTKTVVIHVTSAQVASMRALQESRKVAFDLIPLPHGAKVDVKAVRKTVQKEKIAEVQRSFKRARQGEGLFGLKRDADV
jgi:cold shock protein